MWFEMSENYYTGYGNEISFVWIHVLENTPIGCGPDDKRTHVTALGMAQMLSPNLDVSLDFGKFVCRT